MKYDFGPCLFHYTVYIYKPFDYYYFFFTAAITSLNVIYFLVTTQ